MVYENNIPKTETIYELKEEYQVYQNSVQTQVEILPK